MQIHPITAAGWEGRRIGRHTPCQIFVAGKASVVRRPCSPLLYLHSPPTPRSSLLHHPQPHVLLRPQRRAPGTTAAALSTGTERGRKGRLRERDERKQATEAGAAARREASEGDGGDRRLLLNSSFFFSLLLPEQDEEEGE
jgi:hypothetical protein